eukprot:g2840.t1
MKGTSVRKLHVKTCTNTGSEAGSLDSAEELEVLALLGETEDPNCRDEFSVGSFSGDEAFDDDVKLLETLMHDFQTEERTEIKTEANESVYKTEKKDSVHKTETNKSVHKTETNKSVHKTETNKSVHKTETKDSVHKREANKSVHKTETKESIYEIEANKSVHKTEAKDSLCEPDEKHELQNRDTTSVAPMPVNVEISNNHPMTNFDADIAFFDLLGAEQEQTTESRCKTTDLQSVNPLDSAPELPPFLNIGPPSSTTDTPELISEPSFLPVPQEVQESNQSIRSFVPGASFSPVMYFDGNWSSYDQQNVPVIMAEPQPAELASNSQMVEVYPRQAQGKPPCSLLAFGIGGRAFTLYNENTRIGTSSFSELAVYLRNKNQATVGGFGFLLSDNGASMKDPGIEQNIGPLTPTTNREKILKFLSDRMESTSAQNHGSNVHDLCLIWTTLAILARNRGQLTVKTPEGEVTDPDVIEMLTVKDPDDPGLGMNHGAVPVLKDVQSRNQFEQQHITGQIQQALLYGKQKEALELAKEGGMWPLAIALSHSLDPIYWTQTLEEMSTALLYDGPLKAHFLLLAGKSAHSFSPVAGFNKSEMDAPIVSGNGTLSVFTPDHDPLLVRWRSTLAILIANRLPGFREMMILLGDKLWQQRNEVCAAHLCYLLAAVVPQSISTGHECRMALLGADHRLDPDHFITIDAIQRTEILEWILMNGKLTRRLVCFVPYKLHFAKRLAEYGKISEAIQYCEVIMETIKNSSSRFPKELVNCKYQTNDLLAQLKAHAEAFNINIERQTTLLKRMGDLFDKGINRLIGVSEVEDEIHRAPPSSDGVALSEVHSFKKSSSLASLGSSTTGGSVSLGGAGGGGGGSQYNHSPIRQSQNWFHRMLGTKPVSQVSEAGKQISSVESIPDYSSKSEFRNYSTVISQPHSMPSRSDPALEFEDIRL